MSKLILTLDGAVIREYPIEKDSLSIGRKHGNDIQLNDLTVSGRHALIISMGEHIYVDDLGSTNGTLMNGARVTKTLIKHGDVIQVGNYQFTFYDDTETEYEPTMFIQAEIEDTQLIDTKNRVDSSIVKGEPLAGVKIINGPLTNKILELRKPFNTIGFNGIKMAMISRATDHYTISALKSHKLRRTGDAPTLNGKVISTESIRLKENDIIELAGTKMEFFYLH
ncbi:MAG TPA: FHA domain-containing protein [Gammaproteobacteria bacterium]|nr:FHA domain-containing protein [Gammaproteobacteria bacterium]